VLRVVNPATEGVAREVPEDDAASIADKVRRARAAQPGWAALSLEQRLQAVRRFKGLVGERAESLARILTGEMGKPIRQARNELAALPERLDFFLQHTAGTIADEVVRADVPPPGVNERIGYEPLGVVANISAWNYPWFIGSNVFVPALLTGNAVLYKPSEHATLTGLAIAGLLREAGVPRDVFSEVVGAGAAGAALLEQDVDGVYFTGSYRTGRAVAAAVAPRLIRVHLELGGKDPAYVCGDVDVAAAAAALAEGAFYNAGQSCCAVERVYVEQRLAAAFTDAFIAACRRFVVGDPLDEATDIGPLARREQLAVLEAQVADAVGLGATVLLGGTRRAGRGWYFEPTVLAGVDHRMAVMREESFGPIIGIQAVAGDGEAVRLMNDTEYGLTAAVYTPDAQRAEGILAQLDVGTAYWNCCDRVSPRLPWSGRKHSGLGSTLSIEGIRAFVRPKAWHLRG
jgi:acyl-CoA reductase-like NAD-dependent aldehyde dehydrogenase